MSLARPRPDAIEPVLAGEATVFVIAVPSREVREALESSRERAAAGADRDSAPPHLVRAHWEELADVALSLGLGHSAVYDPALYASVYRRVLRHRRSVVLRLGRVLSAALAKAPIGEQLLPDPGAVERYLAAVASLDGPGVDRVTRAWYDT